MDSAKLKVKCTYGTCSKHFETEKDMKRHKKDDPEHDYCKKCDVDCADWEDLTRHKVEAMMPWLDGRMKDNKDESPMHIVCEFCGTDFKSFGGRKLHREQSHKADQNIVCPACSRIFKRAGDYVEHLESGRCNSITRKEFLDSVQQKHVTQALLARSEGAASGFQVNKFNKPYKALPEDTASTAEDLTSITEESEYRDSEDQEGGVSLLDQEDEGQKGGHIPLDAEVDLMDFKAESQRKLNKPHLRATKETWPRLPSQAPQMVESMRSMSIASTNESYAASDISATEYASRITDRHGSRMRQASPPPTLLSPMSPSIVDEDEQDAASDTTTTYATQKNTAWNTGNTSQMLFKGAKPTPMPTDWQAILERNKAEKVNKEGSNLLRSRFWDPHHKDSNPDLFFNPVSEKYDCPFQGCGDEYDRPYDLSQHIQNAHLRKEYVCPLCKKRFQKASALISHAESGGNCKVKNSAAFDKLLDEVSGGFLKAEELKQPKVYNTTSTAQNENEQVADGVMSMRFEGQMPNDNQ